MFSTNSLNYISSHNISKVGPSIQVKMEGNENISTQSPFSGNDTDPDYFFMLKKNPSHYMDDQHSLYHQSFNDDDEKDDGNKHTYDCNPKEINKILEKTKRIKRREMAKMRQAQKTSTTSSTSDNKNETNSNSELSGVDDKTNKKLQQKIRNRISAQLSRDRKKAHINSLEQLVTDLQIENEDLKRRNALLENELALLRHRSTEYRNEYAEDYLLGPQKQEYIEPTSFEEEQGLVAGGSYFNGRGLTGLFGFLGICLIISFGILGATNVNNSFHQAGIPMDISGLSSSGVVESVLSIPAQNFLYYVKYFKYIIMLLNLKLDLRSKAVSNNDTSADYSNVAYSNSDFSPALVTYGESELQIPSWDEAKFNRFHPKFIPQTSNNLPVAYVPNKKVSTLFCPSTFIYEKNNEKIKILSSELKDSDHIQFFINTNDFRSFSNIEDDVVTSEIPARAVEGKLIELSCKVTNIHRNLHHNFGAPYMV